MCNMMLMIVLVSIMPSLLGAMSLWMELKHLHPELSGCVLRAILLSNGIASISLSVQRKIFFLIQLYLRLFHLSSGSGKTSILMALLGM